MTDDSLVAKFTYGLELDLGGEKRKNIDNLLAEISKLNHVEKLLLYLKLPGETNIFKSRSRRDTEAESILIQWIKTHLKPDPNFSLLKKNVYENYKSFCISNKYPAVSLNDFGKNLRSMMKTVHHRRLGRRGEALYAYAGVNYIEETKPFAIPELLKNNELVKQRGSYSGSEDDNVESDCDDLSDEEDCDAGETSRRWKNCVSLAVRNLILEWAEKVIDKSIKFKKYKELAEHLFTQNFINKKSRDAYILLSDMRQSGKSKVILPKTTSSSGNYGSNALIPDESHVMQNQTKQKLFNTLAKRDELRQQKKRAKQEDFVPKPEQNIANCSKTHFKPRTLSSSCEMPKTIATMKRSSTLSAGISNVAPKRPASAHQKVILPKIAKIQDSTFKQGTGSNVSNSSSMNQFLFLPSRAANHSTIAPVVIALVSNQSVSSHDQGLQVHQRSSNDQDVVVLRQQHEVKQELRQPLNLQKPLTLGTGVVENFLPKLEEMQNSRVQCLSESKPSMTSNDNLPAPEVLKKVYKDSKFIASVLNDAASNPFGSQNSLNICVDSNQANSNLMDADVSKNKAASVIKSKFSNQTVSTLLNRQRNSGQNLPNSLSFKLASDKRPVSKILQDKREKLSYFHTYIPNVPDFSKDSSHLTQSFQSKIKLSDQIQKIIPKNLLFSLSASQAKELSICKDGTNVCISSMVTDNLKHTESLENSKVVTVDEMSDATSQIISDNCDISHVKMDSATSDSQKAVKSHLFQILNEPIVHPDGSVIFQKNSGPSEILSWFESQENNSIIKKDTVCVYNRFRNGAKKPDKLLFQNSGSKSCFKDDYNENLSVCSPSIFLNDKGNDDLFMPYNNNFAQNLTFQQLSEALKSKSERSDLKISKHHLCFSPSSFKQHESRPVSASIMTRAGCDESFKSSLCLSRPSTVASTIIDDSDKLRNHGLCFTPVQMVESISPALSGVKHPQPLVATVSTRSFSINSNSTEASKSREPYWISLANCDHAGKRTNAGSFVPYTSSCISTPTGSQVVLRKSSQRDSKTVDPMLISEEGLLVYLSSERQRHSSAHETSSGSNNDPWIFNSAAGPEAEIDAILQQGFNESISGSSSGQLWRCHSEPAKCCTPLASTEDILIGNDDEGSIRIRDDKMNELQSKDVSLGDISSNNLGIYFEDEDIDNFNIWSSSNGINEISSPKLNMPKIQESNEFLAPDKEMEFLVDDENASSLVDRKVSSNENCI